jgi:hypothetical protein
VLLSERNPEPSRTNRLQTLPRGGLPKLVALRGGARQNPDEGGRALALLTTQLPQNIPSKQPDEPSVDPLYLFGCGLFWRKLRNASAGWELVRCLRSSGQAARIATAFLSQAENMQLPVRAQVRAIHSPRKPPAHREPAAPASRRPWRV